VRKGREAITLRSRPLVIDIDSPGSPFDAGWASVDLLIASRRGSRDEHSGTSLAMDIVSHVRLEKGPMALEHEYISASK
jgi:hypothetical protein